jgi:hypothetical protein
MAEMEKRVFAGLPGKKGSQFQLFDSTFYVIKLVSIVFLGAIQSIT